MTTQVGARTWVGVRGCNSVAFIETVLQLYRDETPFAIIAPGANEESYASIVDTVLPMPSEGAGWTPEGLRYEIASGDTPAQIVFTSGTEGPPKAVVISRSAIDDVTQRVNEVLGLTNEVREYIGIPIYKSFGLGRVRAVLAAGGRAYLPPGGFNPLEIVELLERDEINAISAVPTLWRSCLQNAELFADVGHRVRWIEIGSEHMEREHKRAMRRLFPNARIVQHYGLTEASRTTFLDFGDCSEAQLDSVGIPTGDVETRIDEDGHVRIRGPNVALGYLRRGRIHPIQDHEGWFRTPDRARMEDGYVYYLGRGDDVVNCGGIKVDPGRIEEQIRARLSRADAEREFAVAGVAHPLRGQCLAICPTDADDMARIRLREAALAVAAEAGIHGNDAVRVIRVASLPVTDTGKLSRRRLSEAATASLASSEVETAHLGGGFETELEETLARAFKTALGLDHVDPDKSFYDQGGDSLSAISMMVSLGRAGIPRSTTKLVFDGLGIRDIARAVGGSTEARHRRFTPRQTADAINICRGLLVLLVIGVHWLPGVLQRLGVGALEHAMTPLFRLGTPGFATVFGLGIGYYLFGGAGVSRSVLWRRTRTSLLLVGIGYVLISAARYGSILAVGQEHAGPPLSVASYNVLLYYLLAVSSIPLWHGLLTQSRTPVLRALEIGVGMLIVHVVLSKTITHAPAANAAVDMGRLMLIGVYNYFVMGASVFLGIALGLHCRKHETVERMPTTYIRIGLLLMAFGVATSFDLDLGDRWFGLRTLFHVATYAGVVLALLGLCLLTSRRAAPTGAGRWSVRIMAALGVLSLPLFVMHEIVRPVKDILVGMGAPYGPTLGALLLVFFAGTAWLVRKVCVVYG